MTTFVKKIPLLASDTRSAQHMSAPRAFAIGANGFYSWLSWKKKSLTHINSVSLFGKGAALGLN